MVCVACLLPLFLIPILNALPLIVDFFLRKLYALFGKEYHPPARVPPSCPMKSTTKRPEQMNMSSEGITAPVNFEEMKGYKAE
ncbi:hypothetical protein KP509_21G010200 [Ceratopteris richardii]|uniref:Uncharacterized protein n=1 Tax=Ceratopteris richardii TaxID=49495 RepID=A0A8T2SA73_CERRI|nr:hypothetical protein KP509_21G010200 [Ceratopteris richardii]